MTFTGCRMGWVLLVLALLAVPGTCRAQQRRVTLNEAVAAAQANAPEVDMAVADTAAARAEVGIARAFPNPALNLDYTKDTPNRHLELEQPLDYPWTRSARIRAAETGLGATLLLVDAERMTVRYLAEIAYIRAAGAAEILSLSRQNVATAAELLRIVQAREAAGDASELDIARAEVSLGQARSEALNDSLTAVAANIELQSLMGLGTATVEVEPADSLAMLPAAAVVEDGTPLRVAAAERRLAASQADVQVARYGWLPAPALRFGFENGDPETGNKPLETFGVSIPLPLFSRGKPEMAQARANAQRAQAELAAVQRETQAAVAISTKEREVAAERLEVERTTSQSAQRVAALSLVAYQEGEYALNLVLEAQRDARDVIRQYLEDLITSRTAAAALRLAVTTGGSTPP